MGRFFSTIYRTILVVFSVAAVVFSILSATSCAFVKFDHQYKDVTRQLVDAGGPTSGENVVSGAVSGGESMEPASTGAPEATMAAVGTVEAPPVEDPTTEATTTVENPTTTEATTTVENPTTTEATTTVENPTMTEITTAASATEAIIATAAQNEGAGDQGQGPMMTSTTTVSSADEAISAAVSTAPTLFAPDSLNSMGGMEGFQDNKGDSAINSSDDLDDPMETTGTTSVSSSDTVFAPDSLDSMGGMEGFQDNKGDSALNPENIPEVHVIANQDTTKASQAIATSNGASQAAATASGDAGLYCDGDQAFSVTNLWGKSVEDLAEELADESDRNQSEEVARAAVVLASMFGSVAAFLMVLTSLIGWRICCERWIMGVMALCACFWQGITFLFFNSERYCDGDIIHEILNQEPCVIGQGGVFSAFAIALYAIVFVMACRLPADDPYSPFCKNDRAEQNEGSANGGGSSRTFFGSKKGGSSELESGGKPESAPWLSEGKGKDENDII